MARVTSAENKRFVSHGFCHCARRSLHCSGTRGPDTTCVLVAKVSCPGTHPMPRSRPRQRWSQGELDECRKFPNAYTHGPGRIPPHRAIRAYHYSQISAKAVPAGPMTGPRSAFRANGSASSSGKTLSSVNIILSRRAFKSQRNPAQRKGQRTGFMCPAQKWPVPDTASRQVGHASRYVWRPRVVRAGPLQSLCPAQKWRGPGPAQSKGQSPSETSRPTHKGNSPEQASKAETPSETELRQRPRAQSKRAGRRSSNELNPASSQRTARPASRTHTPRKQPRKISPPEAASQPPRSASSVH